VSTVFGGEIRGGKKIETASKMEYDRGSKN
jgi:hypothetical protein